jgi:hypothetical protein
MGYAMQGKSFTLHGFLSRLRTMKVDPIAGEMFKPGKSIFDIQVINVS